MKKEKENVLGKGIGSSQEWKYPHRTGKTSSKLEKIFFLLLYKLQLDFSKINSFKLEFSFHN